MTRVGGPGGLLKVRVEIDKLGDLQLKISDLFGGRRVIGKIPHSTWIFDKWPELIYFFISKDRIYLYFSNFLLKTENIGDFLINNMWQPGFPFVRPLINELVSTAFTDIFNESFRDFPVDDYVK